MDWEQPHTKSTKLAGFIFCLFYGYNIVSPFMIGLLIPPDLMWQNEITGVAAVCHSQWKLFRATYESRIAGTEITLLNKPKMSIKDDA